MKKTLSLILALLMSLSTAVVAFADEEPAIDDTTDAVVDTEVVEGPYDDAIKYLGHYGIYKGVSADNLAADQLVNRNQMARFAARIATGWTDNEDWENGPLNTSAFTDLAENEAADYYGAISYAAQMGIIEGYGDGTYGPLDNITYQNALTIVVRTLGYQNLDWPWGYIQKAVELGLTDGIEGVAYTQDLTRGEVAQIIYNALFAETKNGSTLGLESFDIEFAWENVIITASDRDVFLTADKSKVAAGFVGFQLVEDGELDETVYYAKASDFGLDAAKHEDDLAVGASAYVFFEKDADSELVKIIDYKSNYVDTAWNFGNDADPEIKALFDNEYKLVDKYSGNYVGGVYNTKPEMIVFDALGGILELTYVDSKYGVDMSNGNIVVYKEVEDENGDLVKVIDYVEWYYNDILDAYYDIVFKASEKEVGIRYMDAKAEAELLKAVAESTKKWVETDKLGFARATTGIDKESAYASLSIYDVDGKAYGIYEEYKFGYFSNAVKYCASCDKDRASFKIESKVNYKSPDALHVVKHETFNENVEKACDHTGLAFINENFADNKVVAEDGTVSYKDGYVIYSADKQTGEIKILKYINDCEDEDTYVEQGTVTAFSVNDEYVVINGEKLTFNYDKLEGAGIINVFDKDHTQVHKAQYSDLLREFFNQYVEYVVVDGEVVYMAIVGKQTRDFFVVEKYAGLTSDGYIAVTGYWTYAATELTTIRVKSFDNNFNGDMFYYATKDRAEDAFTKGAVYAVSSKEPVENGEVYNVQIVGEFKNGRYTIDTASKYVDTNGSFTLDATDCKDGYIKLNGATKRNKTRTFILIGDSFTKDNAAYSPIAVYTGTIADPEWKITEGTRIDTSDDEVYLVVNAKWVGFSRDKIASGVVALLGDFFWEADFDGSVAEDWYLLGASEYTVEVFDFYTASFTTVETTNLGALKENYVYKTIDGKIVYDTIYGASEIMTILKDVRADDKHGSADYHIAPISVSLADYDDIKADIAASVCEWIFGHKKYDDLVAKVEPMKLITVEDEKIWISDFNKTVLEDIAEAKDADDVTLSGFYVYNPSSEIAILYVFAGELVTWGGSETDVKVESDRVLMNDDYVDRSYITATTVADLTKVEGEVTSATLKSITFTMAGELAADDHHSIYNKGLHFGEAGICTKEDWNCSVVVDDDTANPDYILGTGIEEVVYAPHGEDGDACNLIKALTITLDEPVVITEVPNVWAKLTVKFTNSAGFTATINLAADILDGELVVNIMSETTGVDSSYIAFDTVVEK